MTEAVVHHKFVLGIDLKQVAINIKIVAVESNSSSVRRSEVINLQSFIMMLFLKIMFSRMVALELNI